MSSMLSRQLSRWCIEMIFSIFMGSLGVNGVSVTITVESPVIANVTDNITLPCSYTTDATFIVEELVKWYKQDPRDAAGYHEVYEWQKRANIHTPKPNYQGRSTVEPPANLVLYNVSREDRGIYKCEVHIIPSSEIKHALLLLQVNEKPGTPFIVFNPSSSSITADVMQSVTCQVNGGSPLANLSLFRDHHKLTSSDGVVHIQNSSARYVAVIYSWKPTSADDKAKIRCKAVSDVFGEYTLEITHTLTVMYKPENTKLTGNKQGSYLLGETATLICSTLANPNASSFQWGGPNRDIGSTTSNKLSVALTTLLSGGTYSCTPSNNIGQGPKGYAIITVDKIPEFTGESFTNGSIQHPIVNETFFKLNCSAVAKPIANISWTVMENTVNNDNDFYNVHTVNRIQPDGSHLTYSQLLFEGNGRSWNGVRKIFDNGKYVCTVENTINSRKYSSYVSSTVNVRYSAEFTNGKPPRTHVVKERENAVIECTATGNPNIISYTWKKDGVNVKSFGQNFTVSSDGTLIIQDAHYRQRGDYTCEISNGIEPSRERITNVIIKYLRVLVSSPKEVDENHNITLVCNATGTPTITYHVWNFQGKALPTATQGQQLHLKDVKYTDAGTYTCSASNGDFTKSASSNILVRYAPRQDPKIKHCFKHGADIGENVAFNISVIAYPPPTQYQWIKERNSLNISLGYSNTSYTLRSITENDFGNYTCEVRNDVGMARFTFSLSRKGTPDTPLTFSLVNKSSVSITVQWKPNFNGGYPQTFSVEYVNSEHSALADGIPDPGYGRLVQKKLESLHADTEYSVRVQAVNGFRGRAESGYTEALFVKTLGKPEISKKDLGIEIGDRKVILTWPQIKTNITSIVIIYCHIETSICSSVFVYDTQTRTVKIKLSDGYKYSYNLKLYQGDDLIFETSPLIKMMQPPGFSDNESGLIAGVVVTVLFVTVCLGVLVVYFRRRKGTCNPIYQCPTAKDTSETGNEMSLYSSVYPPDSQ